MNQNNAPRKRKVFVSKTIKFVIAAASVASTVGLWGVFSKQNVQTVQADAVLSGNSAMPTITALNTVNVSKLVTTNTTNNPLAMLPVATQPATHASVSAGSVQILQPAPITQTRSSRK